MFVAIAILIGLLFAVDGLSFKVSSLGKINVLQNLPLLSFGGCILFGLLGWRQWENLTWVMIVSGVLFGGSQYLTVRLFNYALRLGPFSPMWCAFSLAFMPVIVYAGIFRGETLSSWQYGSIAATVGAIIAASLGGKNESKRDSSVVTWRGRLLYGLLLVVILAMASVMNLGLKFLSWWSENGTGQTVLERGDDIIMCFTYLTMLISSSADLTISRQWRFNRFAVYGGIMLLGGALIGYLLMLRIITAPAVIVFALSNSMSILVSSLGATLLLREKRTRSWYLTIIFSLLAVLLNR